MLLLIFLQILSLAAVGERAAGIQVRAEHGFVRAQELASLSHEVHTAHNHYLGIGFGSLASQCQRITHKVGNILNLTNRVVVGEDNRIFLLAKLSDFSLQVQGLVDRFIHVTFLYPIVFHHNINIIFLYFLFFKKEYKDDDMTWKSG